VLFNIALLVTRFIIVGRNAAKRKEAVERIGLQDSQEVDAKISHAAAFEDLTDIENPEFRYVL